MPSSRVVTGDTHPPSVPLPREKGGHDPVASSGLHTIERRLDTLKRRSLGRQLRPAAAGAEPWIELEGRRLLNLSSNNYLGLATHPEVIAASISAAEAYGCGAGSARLVAGD